MRVLLTGRGSIAQRHARHLRMLVPEAEVAVLSGGEPGPDFGPHAWLRSWKEVDRWSPQAVIVASVSARHAQELGQALESGWPCLAEKPLVTSRAQLHAVQQAALASTAARSCLVGCNLRCLPSLQAVRAALLQGLLGTVVRAHFEVGQDLAQWRPSRALAHSYSCDAEQGGGVLFDLVHEVDMALWLLGPMSVCGAVAGRLSGRGLRSDDVHVGLMRLANGAPVTVAMDYVSNRLVRRYAVVGTRGTLVWDLAERACWVDSEGGWRPLAQGLAAFDVAQTYHVQMQDWLRAIHDPSHVPVSPLEDAFATTDLMLALQEAAG